MIEVKGDLWTYPADVRIITTNGFVKKNGRAVMGRGCAKEAALLILDVELMLGEKLLKMGNNVHILDEDLYTFPVKHNWWEKADIELIRRSAEQLADLMIPARTYVMPRAGCGNGKLKWGDVRSIFTPFPDNLFIIDYA